MKDPIYCLAVSILIMFALLQKSGDAILRQNQAGCFMLRREATNNAFFCLMSYITQPPALRRSVVFVLHPFMAWKTVRDLDLHHNYFLEN